MSAAWWWLQDERIKRARPKAISYLKKIFASVKIA
jgi:hypothetical protein